MFFDEVDIEPAVKAAIELFGPQGNMLHGKNIQKNVVIGTDKFGKLWYGDIEGNYEYIISLMSILDSRIGQPSVFVIKDNF